MDINAESAQPLISAAETLSSEMFERVWHRVMPDQQHSPIQIAPPPVATAPAEPWRNPPDAAPPPPPWPPMPPPEPSAAPPWPAMRLQEADTGRNQPARPTPFQWEPAVPVLAETVLTPQQTVTQNTSGTWQMGSISSGAQPQAMTQQDGQTGARSSQQLRTGSGELGELQCLGGDSMLQIPLIEEMIDHAQAGVQSYQALSRRASGRIARTLSAMADDQRKFLRQLSSIHFLITAERYQPSELPVWEGDSLLMGLREQFILEQQWANRYALAAEQTQDACLREAFGELGAEASIHARTIRGLVEQLHLHSK